MVRATGIESNGGADEDIAIDTPAMSAAVIGDIIDALAGVLSCSREVIELAVMTLSAATRDAQGVRFGAARQPQRGGDDPCAGADAGS